MVDRNLEVHMGLVHYCSFGQQAANGTQNVRVNIARGKGNNQQNLSKMIMGYCSVYNQMLQMSKDAIILFISS